jgi:hypothetical protein
VIEQGLETAVLMLGSDKSRGYCLEMICADFLAGANLDNGNLEILLSSMIQLPPVPAPGSNLGYVLKHPGAWVIGNNHGEERLGCCFERPIRMTCHINPAIPTMPAAQPNFI